MSNSASQPAMPRQALYACPMHPHVRQATPGLCPICGMALQPEAAGARALGPVSLGRPFAFGTFAAVVMLAVYFGVLTLVSGWDFTVSEFSRFWHYVLPLTLGFGVQIGLYVFLRQRLAQHHGGGGIVIASGATSTGAMLACCTHYLASILPFIGAAGAITLAAQYQVELFWVGLAFNLAGIVFIASRIVSAGRS